RAQVQPGRARGRAAGRERGSDSPTPSAGGCTPSEFEEGARVGGHDETKTAAHVERHPFLGARAWLEGPGPGEWRMTTVDDLARFGALVLHRAPSAPVVEPDEGTGPRVLTPADVNRGQEPSKRLAEPVDLDATSHRVIQAGDVLIPSVMTKGRTCRVRVATDTDDGSLLGAPLHLVRPDPAHVDPWFLAGFLA